MDDGFALDGDSAFVGVNLQDDPATLPAGIAAGALNMRFGTKRAASRLGHLTPVPFNIPTYGAIFGSGIYSDPDGSEWLMCAVADGVWFSRAGRYPFKISLGTGLAITGYVDLVQCFDQVVLFRGVDLAPLSWSGDELLAFELIDLSTGDGGTNPIPNASTGELFANRLLVPSGRDAIAVSDVLDYTRYDAIQQEFRVNSGSDDSLVRIFPYSDTSLLIFKDQSIFLIANIYGDLSAVQLQEVSRELGCVARGSVVRAGTQVLFLSSGGVYSVEESQQLKLHAGATPISQPVDPLFRRINWAAAAGSQAVAFGDYCYFAVPLDGATENNAVIVLNTRTRQWEGYDTFGGAMGISRWHLTDWVDGKALFAVDHDRGRVLLMYVNRGEDVIGATAYPISSWVRSRGYTLGDPKRKRFARAEAVLACAGASFGISAETAAGERAIFTGRTRSRTRYLVHGRTPWTNTNAGDDFATAGRGDYSVTTAAPFIPKSGVNPNLLAEATERFEVRMMGRWCQLTVANVLGHLEVASLSVEASVAQREPKGQL